MSGKTNYKKWLLCVLFVLAAKQTAFAHVPPTDSSDQATIIYVDDDAVGSNDGSSWADAFNYLRDALTTASPGDEIRVAEGTYKPNQGILPLPGRERWPWTPGEEGRLAAFELMSGLTIKGGFAGFGAAEPNAWNPEVYETVLSGDLEDNDADIDVNNPYDYFYEPTRRDNSVNVVTSTADDASAVLDGFIVTGAVNGGLLIVAGSPTILNCVFSRNSASEGSGISIWQGQSLLKNCKFISNIGGGALFGMDIDLTLSKCSFMGNYSGGAFISGSAVLTGCVFSDNTSRDGGGIVHLAGEFGLGKLELIDCAFLNNSAIASSDNNYGSGGAVYTYEATVNNCIFSGNWARHGGAIYGEVQSIENCTFFGNTAEQGGALRGMQGSMIRNSIFAGNLAKEGGVLYSIGPGPNLTGCTLSDNSAQYGNTINWISGRRSIPVSWSAPVSMTISNCILWNGGDEIGTWIENLTDISIVYSNIQGGWPGEGNIDLDPYFAQPGYWDPNGTADDPNDDFWIEGDYHLKSQAGRWDPVGENWVVDDITSPCIDAGDPNSPVAFEPFPNGGIINMGAYGGTAQASKSLIGTSTYTFVPEQRMIIQTGGIAGVNWTYTLTGQFQLTIDFGAGKAWFSNVDAIATDESAPDRKLDPNEVFNLTDLTGTIGRDGTIQFTGQADDGSDIILDITLSDESVSLKGQTIPPPNSADFFIFKVDAVAKRKYGGGNGTAENPYLIYTAEQMNTIGAEPNDWDKHFKLMADIDLNVYKGTDFNIIGKGLLPAFTGVFEGNGHTIYNFIYSSTGEPCIGIFGYVNGIDARISNLYLIDPNVDGGTGTGVGSLAGWIDLGTVANCYVIGGNVTGKHSVGGLVGTSGVITDCYAEEIRVIAEGSAGGLVGSCSGSIINCYATGNVTGLWRTGGLVGSSIGSIVDSYSHANVEGQDTVGGLVGYNNRGIVTNCYSTSGVIGKNSTGGLVGENKASIINCYCSCTIDAQDQVGGLVGINDGVITASYSSASIHGRDEIGGMVGYNSDDGEILNCYANGDADGHNYVGGLVGNNATGGGHGGGFRSGTIRNCYSVTLVSGNQNVGGLIGYYGDDGVSSSFWDIETSGQTTSDGGVGKTTSEMQDPNTFIEAGWDFAGAPGGPGDIWAESEGGGYPVLVWQLSPPPELPAFSGGSGEPDDPYLISTAGELNNIGHNPRLMTAHFKLVNNIDLTAVDFNIIASQYYPYRGTFDGDGHTISNFSYASPEASCIGLFSYVFNGWIKNLGLINPNVHVDEGDFHGCMVGLLEAGNITHCYIESGSITGQDELGGLVGENGSGGIIMNCYFTGETTGNENVGGLVGQNRGSIAASYSYADITGRTAVGGLVGRCSPGEITNCYAQGNISGNWYVGGLVGSNGSRGGSNIGTILNCYSTSTIVRAPQKGGLLGVDWGGAWSGAVNNCFWDIEASRLTTSYGGEGKTTEQMQTSGTFLDAGWDFVDETANGTKDIWRILEGQDYPRLWWELITNGNQ